MTSIKNIRTLSKDEIQSFLEEIGEPRFRAGQVYEWIWLKHAHSFADMTNLSKPLRQKLGEAFSLPALVVDATQYSADGTVKSRFRTHDHHLVEGVLIPTEDRRTACVSSQIGCSLT
ncbi:MAG: 23S rRNA (adenine(2503)-C(2))-methyltransferase RlmN, partial [Bacteroidota bacterium]